MFHYPPSQSCGPRCFNLHSSHSLKLITKPTVFQISEPLRNCTILFSTAATRTCSTKRDPELRISSTDYLVTSLGLSPKSSLAISKQIFLKSTSNADSVLALFRDFGFTNTHMAKIFSTYPQLLSSDPLNTLKPKLKFFAATGVISSDELRRIVATDPHILRISLANKIVPCFDFLAAFFGNRHAAFSLLSISFGTRFLRNFRDPIPGNVETLRRCGVPDAAIVSLMVEGTPLLARDAVVFDGVVRDIKEMGFDPSNPMFVRGVRALGMVKKERWVSKLKVLEGVGFTDRQARVLFLKQPTVMTLSEERLKEALEFFTGRLRWSPEELIKYPVALTYSLHNRIFPRSIVMEVLLKRGLVKRSCMGSAFMVSEDKFLNVLLKRYHNDVPQLLEMYQQSFKVSS